MSISQEKLEEELRGIVNWLLTSRLVGYEVKAVHSAEVIKFAVDQYLTLRTERDEARNACRAAWDSISRFPGSVHDRAMAKLERVVQGANFVYADPDLTRALAAEAQLARRGEALKPFADEAEWWGPESGPEATWGNSVELWQSPSRRTKITVGDLRRARSTLSPEDSHG